MNHGPVLAKTEIVGDDRLDHEQSGSGVWSLSAQGWMLADFAARRLMACVREP